MSVCRSRIAGSIDFRQCTGLHRTVLWQMWWLSMNIPGGGIPETYEYRVKISSMLMHMEGLQNGTDSINPDDSLIPACQSLLLFGVNASTASIDERGVLYV